MHKTFKINQHVLLKNSANKILILKQDGKWMLPGGRIEEGAVSVEEELRREIKEETGISSTKETFLITYKTSVKSDQEVRISDEHTDYAWVDKESVNDHEFHYQNVKQKIIGCL